MDEVIFDEEPTHSYVYAILGYFDGDHIYKRFPTYKTAFLEFRATIERRTRKSKWFLDIVMFTWGPKKEPHPLIKIELVSMNILYSEGTYQDFYDLADKKADEALEAYRKEGYVGKD